MHQNYLNSKSTSNYPDEKIFVTYSKKKTELLHSKTKK